MTLKMWFGLRYLLGDQTFDILLSLLLYSNKIFSVKNSEKILKDFKQDFSEENGLEMFKVKTSRSVVFNIYTKS